MEKEKSTLNIKTGILNKVFLILSILCLSFISTNIDYEGTASYYGQHWTGRLTASGERFRLMINNRFNVVYHLLCVVIFVGRFLTFLF